MEHPVDTHLIVCSMFRNSAGYIDRYFSQLRSLQSLTPREVVPILVEGDSTDDTKDRLIHELADWPTGALSHLNHGGPSWQSVDDPARWEALAQVGNDALHHARMFAGPHDQMVWVESDLVWQADTILNLTVYGLTNDRHAVAAMSLHGRQPSIFYDTWGHVGRDGHPFSHRPPYHPDLLAASRYVPISSAGSCFALDYQALKIARFSPVDCIRGIGRTLREAGIVLWLDTDAAVLHP